MDSILSVKVLLYAQRVFNEDVTSHLKSVST